MFDHLTLSNSVLRSTLFWHFLVLQAKFLRRLLLHGTSDRHAPAIQRARLSRTHSLLGGLGGAARTISTLRMPVCDQTVALLRAHARALSGYSGSYVKLAVKNRLLGTAPTLRELRTGRVVVKGRTRKSCGSTHKALTGSYTGGGRVFGGLVDPCPSICTVERLLLCRGCCRFYNVPNRAIVRVTWLAEEKPDTFLVVVQDRILRAC